MPNVIDECADPAAFDALRASTDWQVLIARIPGVSPIADVRRAYLALSTGSIPDMISAAAALDQPDMIAPARGIRMLLLAQLRRYEEVIELRYSRHGISPLDQEEACHAYTALSVANNGLGFARDAHTCIHVALEHAQALGMKDRAHYLSILAGRQATDAGRPDPAAAAALLHTPMPRPRFGLGLRSNAEALMALGAYRDALAVLGPPDADDALNAGLRAFLHVALGLPQVRPVHDDLAYGTVAAGLTRYLNGENDTGRLLDVQHEPQATYARLVAGGMCARNPNATGGSVRRLLREQPEAADRAALWALIRWQASRHEEDNLLEHMTEVAGAMSRCRSSRDLLMLMSRLDPQRYVLLRASPLSWPGTPPTLEHVPVLYGTHVHYRGASIYVPGRIGRVLVREAAGMDVGAVELDRKERGRLTERLVERGVPTAPVNWGYVVRALTAVADIEGGDKSWRAARDRASSLLDLHVPKSRKSNLQEWGARPTL